MDQNCDSYAVQDLTISARNNEKSIIITRMKLGLELYIIMAESSVKTDLGVLPQDVSKT